MQHNHLKKIVIVISGLLSKLAKINLLTIKQHCFAKYQQTSYYCQY